MSRLAAVKEFAFLTALFENGFPVPRPVAQNRHTLVMELIEGLPLRQVQDVPHPERLYEELIGLILKLAGVGLIHGDFNEFNILIREDPVTPQLHESPSPSHSPSTVAVKLTPILIDFPQMLSIDHTNAEMYFDRDVACIKRFFQRRFHFTSDEPGPFFADVKLRVSTPTSRAYRSRTATVAGGGGGKGKGKRERKEMARKGQTAKGEREQEGGNPDEGGERTVPGVSGEKDIYCRRLDIEVEASGFSRQMAKELEKYMREVGVDGDGDGEGEDDRSDLEVSSDEASDDLSEAEGDFPDETEKLDNDQSCTSLVEMSVPHDQEVWPQEPMLV